jgi:hypothetical protein
LPLIITPSLLPHFRGFPLNPRLPRLRLPALALATLVFACAGCGQQSDTPPAETAPSGANGEPPPPPPAVLSPDASNATIERASPPTLDPVALGTFEPGNPVAERVTGGLTVEDTTITGANGASFITERVAIVRGGDEFSAGQRYADIMQVAAEQQVELRHVVEETPPTKTPGSALCGTMKTGYLALASVMEGDSRILKLIGLQGDDLPAATAQGTVLCASTFYIATR